MSSDQDDKTLSADDGGLGKVIINSFHRKGWPMRRVNFGSQARDPKIYRNRRAEMYFELANRIKQREIRLPQRSGDAGKLFSRLG